MSLTFTNEEPPVPAVQPGGNASSRWNRVLAELRRRPGQWAVLEREHRRTVDRLKEQWADQPVDIRALPIGDERDAQGRTTHREVWLRWEG